MRPLYVKNCRDSRLAEPRELDEWNEQFPLFEQEPEAVLGNVRDLNRGSAHFSPKARASIALEYAPPVEAPASVPRLAGLAVRFRLTG
jgi:hypothetical protein